MKINAQPTWIEDLSPQALNSLSLNDKRTLEGSDDVLAHPGFESLDDEDIFDRVESILSEVDLTPKLREIEDSNRSKFGPRSRAKPWSERKDSLYDYFDHEDYDPGEFELVRSGRLRPSELGAVSKNLIKSSSAGLPYLQKKGSVLTDALKNYETEVGKYPCVLYTRTQEDMKTRNVWGYPISDTLHEQRIFIPFLNVEKTMKHRAALLGPEDVDRAVTEMIRGKKEDELIVSLDFSSFDASVSPRLAELCFSAIASHFQPAYAADVYGVFRRFVTIPIHTPSGEVVGPHGVPSGSSFTNTVDSLAQFIASGTEYNCQIQGDDGLYVLPRSDHDVLLERMKSVDFIVNEDKSDWFDGPEGVYLQRYYHPNYLSRNGSGLGGVYSIYRALARIKYLERWTNFSEMSIEGSDFFALRTITILENSKHHPAFESLVRYVHSLDKHGLQFTKQGLHAYSKSMDSKARAGVFNQYGLESGIESFETVKLIRTL
uniref:RdRp n=1 Tax=viral metagenome TaxID=1070528 RepID=A0A2V0R9A6_9ZZZZ